MSRTDAHTPFKHVKADTPWHAARKHFAKSARCSENCGHCGGGRKTMDPRARRNREAMRFERVA